MDKQREMNKVQSARGDNGYMRNPSQPRQSKESIETSKGKLRYEAETKTWNRAKCDKSFTTKETRGEAAHVETHTPGPKTARKERARNTAICPAKCRRHQDNDTAEVWNGTQRNSLPTRSTGETAGKEAATTRTTATATTETSRGRTETTGTTAARTATKTATREKTTAGTDKRRRNPGTRPEATTEERARKREYKRNRGTE